MENMTKEIINQRIESKACLHPQLVMELAYGGPTGSFICMDCQRLISPGVEEQPLLQVKTILERKQVKTPLRLPAYF